MSRASAPRRSARIGTDRRGAGLDGCRTARGTLCAGRPTAIQFLLPAQREASAVSEIHQTHRLGGHTRAAQAALTLASRENRLCSTRLGLCGSSCVMCAAHMWRTWNAKPRPERRHRHFQPHQERGPPALEQEAFSPLRALSSKKVTLGDLSRWVKWCMKPPTFVIINYPTGFRPYILYMIISNHRPGEGE